MSSFAFVIASIVGLSAGCVGEAETSRPLVDPLPAECGLDFRSGYNTCAEAAFEALAVDTGGTMVRARGAASVPDAVVQAIEAGAASGRSFDLLIVLDVTGSMSDDIDAVKDDLDMILGALEEHGDGSQRIGLLTYGDRCADDPWLEFHDLTEVEAIRQEIMDVNVSGGGDLPESVYDAVEQAMVSASWENENRFAIIIGDAGPHREGGSCYETTYEQAVMSAVEAEVAIHLHPILVSLY